MAILSTAKIVGMLSSAKKTGRQIMNTAGEWVSEVVEYFVSGFAGHGWKIWEYVTGKWRFEIDSIVVRDTMIIFELLISKIRAIKGALGITQACGKIKTATLLNGEWLITIEDEMSFVAHDFIRCQDWKNSSLKGYWVEISEIRKINEVDTIVMPISEFTGGIGYTDGMETVKPDLFGMTTPLVGDEIVQFGNSTIANRQSAIYLHADEGGQPAIDILFGIKSKSFAGCVKQRMGGDIPGTDGLKGFYCENGMIKGVDSGGHTVYCIHPDGTAEFGDGSACFATDKSGYIAGGAISWQWDATKQKFVCTLGDVILQWDNLSDDTKENLKGESGENALMYIVEFYINGIQVQNIPCDIHDKPVNGDALVAKLYRIAGNTKELYSAGRWNVQHILHDAETSDSYYRNVLSSVSIPLTNVSEYDRISVTIVGGSTPDDPEISVNVVISKVLANVPEWLVGWDTNKTVIAGEYMISPKLFTGNNSGSADAPILTGIVQGKDCITINSELRTGIFALVDNEVVFELDPITQKYKFKGRVEADEGYFRGKVETALNGTRIEIDPESNSIKMFNQNDIEIGTFRFVESEWNGVINYLPQIRLRRYVDNVWYDEVSIHGGLIMCSETIGADRFDCMLKPSSGLSFFKNGTQTKVYGKT